MIPGEVRVCEGALELNAWLAHQELVVVNDGDRPIQIGSHLHLPDANPALSFDRAAAQGFRLDVPAGTAVRFEPGVSKTVDLVALAGRRQVPGLQVRDRAREQPKHDREPKHVVPFGTPGAPVETPPRAATVRARISDEPAQHASEGGVTEDEDETP